LTTTIIDQTKLKLTMLSRQNHIKNGRRFWYKTAIGYEVLWTWNHFIRGDNATYISSAVVAS